VSGRVAKVPSAATPAAVDAASKARGRVAVLSIEHLGEQTIVECVDGDVTRVARIFCDLGVLEPRDEGLVIVALAPGVSATEMQALVGPTLKVTHEVSEMVLS
jgi:acyl CoA:acetate/3-ketoacid CoA transferase beta subunit